MALIPPEARPVKAPVRTRLVGAAVRTAAMTKAKGTIAMTGIEIMHSIHSSPMTFLSQRVLGASPRLIAASNEMPANGMMTHPEEVLRYLASRSPKQTDLDSAILSGDGLCPVILAFT